MIFGAGLFLFIVAYAISAMQRPEKPGFAVSTMGLLGCLLMLGSFCVAIARFMP